MAARSRPTLTCMTVMLKSEEGYLELMVVPSTEEGILCLKEGLLMHCSGVLLVL